MDVLTFITKLIEHGLWPAVMIGLFVYLVRNLEKIAAALRSIKFKDFELNFREEIKDLRVEAQDAGMTIQYPLSEMRNFPKTGAEQQVALLKIWSDVENVLVEWAKGHASLENERNPQRILAQARKERLIDGKLHMLASRLLALRNHIAHAGDVTLSAAEVIEFEGLGRSINSRLAQRLTA